MEKFFYNIEDVLAFASKSKFENPERIHMPFDNKSFYNGLVVDGFSRIVPCFEVLHRWDSDEYEFLDSYWVLEIIPTGERYKIYEKRRDSKMFGLRVIEELVSYIHRCQLFHFDRKKPNFMRKATEKKLREWIDYLHEEHEAKTIYIEKAMELNRSKVEAFREKYPDGFFLTEPDGWTEFFQIEFERLRIKYIAHENGQFCRQVEIIGNRIPTDEELLA